MARPIINVKSHSICAHYQRVMTTGNYTFASRYAANGNRPGKINRPTRTSATLQDGQKRDGTTMDASTRPGVDRRQGTQATPAQSILFARPAGRAGTPPAHPRADGVDSRIWFSWFFRFFGEGCKNCEGCKKTAPGLTVPGLPGAKQWGSRRVTE
jgi:hypothetical protein